MGVTTDQLNSTQTDLNKHQQEIKSVSEQSTVTEQELKRALEKASEQASLLEETKGHAADVEKMSVAEKEALRKKEEDLENRVAELQKQLHVTEEDLTASKEESENLRKQAGLSKDALSERIEKLEDELGVTTDQLNSTQTDLNKHRQEIKSVSEQSTITKQELKQLLKAGEGKEKSFTERLRTVEKDFEQRLTGKEKEIRSADKKAEAFSKRIEGLENETISARSEIERFKHKLVDEKTRYVEICENAGQKETTIRKETKAAALALAEARRKYNDQQKQLEKLGAQSTATENGLRKSLEETKSKADILTELHAKTEKELKQLHRQYEPILAKSEKRERSLNKQLLNLENVNAKLLENRPPLSERIVACVHQVQSAMQSAEKNAGGFPMLRRLSTIVVLLILCSLGTFIVGRKMNSPEQDAEISGTLIQNIAVIPQTKTPSLRKKPTPSIALSKPWQEDFSAVPVKLEPTTEADTPLANISELDLSPEIANIQNAVAPETTGTTHWPQLVLDGAKIAHGNISCTIIFDYGVFTSLTTLSSRGIEDFGKIASQLRKHMSRFALIIEGHTDNVPLSSRSSFSNNYALGTKRAETVAKLLTTKFKLPRESVYATSAGATDAPYPNDSAASQRKNRTVVLKIIEK